MDQGQPCSVVLPVVQYITAGGAVLTALLTLFLAHRRIIADKKQERPKQKRSDRSPRT